MRVLLPAGADAGAVRDALAKTITDLTLDTLNLATGPAVQGVLTEKQIRERTDYAITKNIETIRNRVNELGVAEPIVQRQGTDRINVQLAGVLNSAEVKDILGKVATLEWRLDGHAEQRVRGESPQPRAARLKLYTERGSGAPILLKREVIVTGDNLTDAQHHFAGRPGRRHQARLAWRRRDVQDDERERRSSHGRRCSSRRVASRSSSTASRCCRRMASRRP